MKKKENFILIAVIAISVPLIFVAGCATGESTCKPGYDFSKINKVAVIDIAGDIQGDTAKNQIADYFGMELMKKGYSPIERSQVQSLLKEQSFQGLGLTSPSTAAQAGRILNVPIVLIANVDYGEQMSMTAKMIDVETGSIVWMGSGSGRTGKGLNTVLGATLGALGGGSVAGHDWNDRAVGAAVGGILGGVAGEALTPQQAVQAQKIIKKICVSLPSKFGIR